RPAGGKRAERLAAAPPGDEQSVALLEITNGALERRSEPRPAGDAERLPPAGQHLFEPALEVAFESRHLRPAAAASEDAAPGRRRRLGLRHRLPCRGGSSLEGAPGVVADFTVDEQRIAHLEIANGAVQGSTEHRPRLDMERPPHAGSHAVEPRLQIVFELCDVLPPVALSENAVAARRRALAALPTANRAPTRE